MNRNTSSDKSSQPVNVKSEHPSVTRRTLLKSSAALAAAALGTHAGMTALGASPLVEAGAKRSTFPAPAFLQGTTLRVVGTGVSLLDPIKAQAEQDLGITLQYDVKDGLTAQQIAVTQPQAWDIYDQWFNSVKIVWGAGVCQPVDVTRLPQWENLSPLTTVFDASIRLMIIACGRYVIYN